MIGFNVRAGANAKELADREEIEIRTYSIIYAAIDDVKEGWKVCFLRNQRTSNRKCRNQRNFKISKGVPRVVWF